MSTSALTALEVASSSLVGRVRPEHPLPQTVRVPAISAFEAAVRAALMRPPCLVAFSGGRDSSAVLATAARVARREGLPPPIPVTNRFVGIASTDEDDWQELIVRHLGLEDWVRLDHTDELDMVGPIATGLLLRHGLLWPFNSHFMAPMAAAGRGGSLVTGVGGDELFDWPWPGALAFSMLTLKVRPTKRRLKHLMAEAGPRTVRRAVRRRRTPSWPWLRPGADAEAVRASVDWAARTPARFDACIRHWWWPSRYLQTCARSLAAVASDFDVMAVNPFADRTFLAALAKQVGWRGFMSRTHAMTELFGDVLPSEMLSRASKAVFTTAFFSNHSRQFVHGWSGGGISEDLVSPERLHATWSSPTPDVRSFSLLQAAWLAEHHHRAAAQGTGTGTPGLRSST